MTLRRLLLGSQIPFWILLVGAFLLVNSALNARISANRKTLRSEQEISAAYQVANDVLSMESGVRGYVITGEPTSLDAYHRGRVALPDHVALLREQIVDYPQGGQQAEARLNRLTEIMARWQTEIASAEINAVQSGRVADAEAIVRSVAGKKLTDEVRRLVEQHIEVGTSLLVQRQEDAARRLVRLRFTLVGGALLALLASVLVTNASAGFISRRLGRVTRAAGQIAQGQEGVQLPPEGPSEIRQLVHAFNDMSAGLAAAHTTEAQQAQALSFSHRWSRQLAELSDWMQAARSMEEGGEVLGRALPTLLPGTSGTLLQHNTSRNLLLPLVSWGDMGSASSAPEHCWALRRGETRTPENMVFAPQCRYRRRDDYVCVPLFSHGETLGILQLCPAVPGEVLPEATMNLLPDVARQVSLALAGLRLQERLRQQSIRDPLTGLYNRRYLEGELAQQVAHTQATGEPLSVIALDVDHFKRLNDAFGHEAGDAALVRISAALRDAAPPGSTPARPGGEEFTLLLPGYEREAAAQIAERLREQIAGWSLSHSGIALGQITVSQGVASWSPEVGSGEGLVRQADEALYRAKHEGRNRVVQAGRVPAQAQSLPHD